MPSTARDRRQVDQPAVSPSAVGVVLIGWLVPGAAHALLGQFSKAALFFTVLTGMFALGCGLDGRLFPFDSSEWLVLLAAFAEWGVGLPRVVAGIAGVGAGSVTSITYEYGNTFLMASGLLNMLVALNAADVARGRGER
jgi:hypothetical protein